MNSMILLTALSVGQLPDVPSSPPRAIVPPAIATPGAAFQPAPVPPAGMPPATDGNGAPAPVEEPKAEEPPPTPEPYALMRALKGTPAGDRLDALGITVSGWAQGNYTASTANVTETIILVRLLQRREPMHDPTWPSHPD